MINTADIPVEAVIEAARRTEIVAAMHGLYEQADREIAEQNATCWNSGECCRFGQYGHRLFVTTLEVAYYLANVRDDSSRFITRSADTQRSGLPLPIFKPSTSPADTCPHAYDGRCQARVSRPLGCRIFYCDPAAQHWQGPMTERYLARLRRLHEDWDVPYVYVDWMSVLRALQGHGAALKPVGTSRPRPGNRKVVDRSGRSARANPDVYRDRLQRA